MGAWWTRLRARWPLVWRKGAEARTRAAVEFGLAQGRELRELLEDERKLKALQQGVARTA